MPGQSGKVWTMAALIGFVGLAWAAQAWIDRIRLAATSRTQTHPSVILRGGPPSPAIATRGMHSHDRALAPLSALPFATAGGDVASQLSTEIPQWVYWTLPLQYFVDPVVPWVASIAVGDVSGDGRDDLVFDNRQGGPNPLTERRMIYVAYQSPDGRLEPAIEVTALIDVQTSELLVADLDHDGAGEIIASNREFLVVLDRNASGTFTMYTAFVGDPEALVVTDVDRDGTPDVLVDASNTTAVAVHGPVTDGVTRTTTHPLPASAVRTTGDVTGDGLDDLILGTIVDRPLEEFRIYPALATGGYGPPIVLSLPLGSNHTLSLAVGDFNADGRGDLALSEARNEADLRIYLQDESGKLMPSFQLSMAPSAGELLATDLDRDGRDDLAIAHVGWGDIGYYLQSDTGLMPEIRIDANQQFGRRNFFATGDLNRDGCGDLIVSRWVTLSPVIAFGHCDYLLPLIPGRRPGTASE